MLGLPPLIAARYRPATEREVHARSFGQVKAPRNTDAAGWEQRRGTLEDQRIFGPLRDFECACGKYRGLKYENMICDRCGVKVTTGTVRRRRFGHIDLPGPIVHPLGENGEHISAISVLPAAFVESRGGGRLAELYDELVRGSLSESVEGLVGSFQRLLELILPAAIVAHEWDLQEAEVLTWGLVLEARASSTSTAHDACAFCGYPLEGLEVLVCPGCRQKLG
jgi:hypothetical protein